MHHKVIYAQKYLLLKTNQQLKVQQHFKYSGHSAAILAKEQKAKEDQTSIHMAGPRSNPCLNGTKLDTNRH